MWMLIVLFLAAPAVACNKGCQPYQDGICVCDPPQETYKMAPTPTSEEKPPTEKMPSYQRAGIHADMPMPADYHQQSPGHISDGVPMLPNDGVPKRN